MSEHFDRDFLKKTTKFIKPIRLRLLAKRRCELQQEPLTVREYSKILKCSMKTIHEVAQNDVKLCLNVAASGGGSVWELPKADQTIEYVF